MNEIKDVKFFEAGKAIFTVSSPSGKRYTYQIHKPDEKKPFFVSLLTGPDNTNDFNYLGLYHPQSHRIILTAKSKFNEESKPYKAITWALSHIANKEPIPLGYAIQHEGCCCRCGRRLTTPESINEGIGPECKSKLGY